MLSSLAKLVMLTAAILAAAPPGACCAANAAAASPKVRSCCAQKASAPAKNAPVSQAPKASCCCQQPVTEQTKVSIERADSFAVALPAAAIVDLQSESSRGQFALPRLLDAGPPLNLLHCVWRC